MILAILLLLLLSFAIAYALFHLFWRDHRLLDRQGVVKLSLSTGMGLGISSLLYFVSLVLFGSSDNPVVIIEISLLTILLLTSRYIYSSGGSLQRPQAGVHADAGERVSKPLLIGFWGVLGILTAVFVLYTLKRPHGTWDAWGIWNIRARCLFDAGGLWPEAFSVYWIHPDYPLLIPGSIARIWSIIGDKGILVPPLIAFLFTFSTIGLLASSLSCLRSRNLGLIAGLTLMAMPFFVENGSWQTADVPLGFFMLATMVLFAFHDSRNAKPRQFIFFAGIAAGLACWTKNEGLMFLICVFLARALVLVRVQGMDCLRGLGIFSAGCLPVVVIVVFFKLKYAPANDLIVGQNHGDTLERLLDIDRYLIIGKHYFLKFYSLLKIRMIIFPLLLILLGISKNRMFRDTFRTGLLTLSLVLAGYFLVYVVTPLDLEHHLNTSLRRLFLQLLPAGLFVFFLKVSATPFFFSATEDDRHVTYQGRGGSESAIS